MPRFQSACYNRHVISSPSSSHFSLHLRKYRTQFLPASRTFVTVNHLPDYRLYVNSHPQIAHQILPSRTLLTSSKKPKDRNHTQPKTLISPAKCQAISLSRRCSYLDSPSTKDTQARIGIMEKLMHRLRNQTNNEWRRAERSCHYSSVVENEVRFCT